MEKYSYMNGHEILVTQDHLNAFLQDTKRKCQNNDF